MRKRSPLALVVFSAAVRTEIALGVQEFRGWAVPIDVDDYAAMSCTYMEKAEISVCAGQCAEIWCDNDDIGDCVSETRIIKVANRCANCEDGDLVLSRYTFQQFSGGNMHLAPIRWRCVDCGTITSRSVSSNDVAFIEEVFHRGSHSWDDTSSVGETNEDGKTLGGKITFSADFSRSPDNDTSGSLNTEVEISSTDNSHSKRDSSSGEGDNSGSGDFWSSSGLMQTNTKPWNEQGQKTAPPMPNTSNQPSTMIPSPLPASSPSSPISGASLTSVPLPTVSPAISSNGGSWFVSPPPASTSPASGGPNYPVESVATPADNSPDSGADEPFASAGLSGSTSDTTADNNQSSAATTASPALPSGGSTDNSTSDGNLSATSPVAKSPFFYASIVLGIASLVGVIVGYRAKREQNHRIEMRAFRMSARTDTPASISRLTPSPLVPQTHFDNRSIVIL